MPLLVASVRTTRPTSGRANAAGAPRVVRHPAARSAVAAHPGPMAGFGLGAHAPTDAGGPGIAAVRRLRRPLADCVRVRGCSGGRHRYGLGRTRVQPSGCQPSPMRPHRGHRARRRAARRPIGAPGPARGRAVHGEGGPRLRPRTRWRRRARYQCRTGVGPLGGTAASSSRGAGRRGPCGACRTRMGVESGHARPRGDGVSGPPPGVRRMSGRRRLRLAFGREPRP